MAMTFIQRLRQIGRDERGSYIVEFASLTIPLLTIMLGGVEIGYHAYAKSRVEGALREVSRLATTGTLTEDELDAVFHAQVAGLNGVRVEFDRRSYSDFEDVGEPEPLTKDLAPQGGAPGAGDCYTDINFNDQWDEDMGAEGVGGASEIQYYGVAVSYDPVFNLATPILSGAGDDGDVTINANVVIKNEPFSDEEAPEPEEKCIPVAAGS